MQAATHIAKLPAARSALQIRQLSMATRLLLEAVPHQRARAAAILAAAVGLQALCLASRPGRGGGASSSGSSSGEAAAAAMAATNLLNLSHSMIRASAAAQEAAHLLLLEQPAAQVSNEHRNQVTIKSGQDLEPCSPFGLRPGLC